MKGLFYYFILIIGLTSCTKVTQIPEVTTDEVVYTNSSVIFKGNVTETGGDAKTKRGFYWSTEENVTIDDNSILDNADGEGSFEIDITSQLTLNQNYFVVAFAENKLGIAYGEERGFSYYGNPNGASINSKGCMECDSYAVGDTFMIDGGLFVVASKNMLSNAINSGQDLSMFCTSKITNMSSLFYNISTTSDISIWDVSNVTKMDQMFMHSDFYGDISKWDVSNVLDMSSMFEGAESFNSDISLWDVSSVKNMALMFDYALSFNQDIGGWDVSNVTNMENLFNYASNFNKDIGDWDVSNVTEMKRLLAETDYFNHDLSGWCVTKITSPPYKFAYNSQLSSSNQPIWGTCP